MAERFVVRRETMEERTEGGPDWLVVDGEQIFARYFRRTNWIDGKPFGPEAAARERAAKLNREGSDHGSEG